MVKDLDCFRSDELLSSVTWGVVEAQVNWYQPGDLILRTCKLPGAFAKRIAVL